MEAYNVYIAQLIQPKIVSRSCSSHKVPVRQVGIELRSGDIKFMEDPLLDETLFSSGLVDATSVRTKGDYKW